MAAAAESRAPWPDYRHAPPLTGRVVTVLLVSAVHLGLFGWFWLQSDPPAVTSIGSTMMVSFVSAPREQEAQPAPPPPVPAPLPPLKSAPSLIAASSPASEAVITSAPEELPPAPAPAAPPAVSPASAPAVNAELAIVPPDYRAAYLNNPGPRYPVASRRRREQGVVMLKVRVSPAGEPEQVQVDQSSGFAELDQAAASVVKERWRFAPARQGDRPVAAWVAVPMQFSLKDH
jgi:protein TonB